MLSWSARTTVRLSQLVTFTKNFYFKIIGFRHRFVGNVEICALVDRILELPIETVTYEDVYPLYEVVEAQKSRN